MECTMVGTTVHPCLIRVAKIGAIRIDEFDGNMVGWKGLDNLSCVSTGKSRIHHLPWRLFCTPISLEEKFSSLQSMKFPNDEEPESEALREEALLEPPSREEVLKALLNDSERLELIKKLSQANQENRFLKARIQYSEESMVNFKGQLSIMEYQIKDLVSAAREINNYIIPDGSRTINGNYIQSHLLSLLEAFQRRLDKHTNDVNAAQLQEVSLFWSGVAESVQVMGSFDGWGQGEHLSPEYSGLYVTFSTTLMLRPGRYEIKFLVDGEWQLSPEFPSVGEGLTQNNLLIVG